MNMSSEIFPTDGLNGSVNCTMTHNAEIFSVMYITIILSVPTISYVTWLIVTGTGNGLAAEFFTLNLCFCEILLCVTNLFNVVPNNMLSIISYFGQGLPMTGRPLFQSLICVERYLAVVHPVTFLKFKPLRYKMICCVIVWSAVLAACCLVVFCIYVPVFPKLLFCFIVVEIILLLSIQLFCCLAVLRGLKKAGPGERNREKAEENHMKRKAFNVILVITVSTVIIYVPVIVTNFIELSPDFDSTVLIITVNCLFTLGGLVQPFLFLHRVGKLPFIKCK